MTDQQKKPNWFQAHKRLSIVWGVIAFFAIVSIASGGSKTTNTKQTTNTAVTNTTTSKPSTPAASTTATKVATRQAIGTATTLGAGTFAAGKDIAVGLYDVTAPGQSGNFSTTGTDSYNEILGTDNSLGEVPQIRVQVSADDQIKISGLSSVTFTPVNTPFVTAQTTTDLYAGTFIVGQDVAAGRYIVTPGSGQSGNFMVSGNNSYNEILGSDSSLGEVPSLAVTLAKGDVVSISSLSQVVFTPTN